MIFCVCNKQNWNLLRFGFASDSIDIFPKFFCVFALICESGGFFTLNFGVNLIW